VAAPAAAPAVAPEPTTPQSAPSAPLHLNPEQAGRLERYSPAGHRLLAERIAAARAVLDRAPDEGYSIELFTTDNSDPARMERFLLRARDFVQLGELFVIPMQDAGVFRLRVVYGEFPTRDQAAAAEKRLPPRYQEAFRTELRSFGELRGQL
jgi:septal ring-binding cell division protein DamX